MTDQTPLEALDDAIHTFAAAINGESTLSTWVLSYETTRVQTEQPDAYPLVHTIDYATSPGASPTTAIGLARTVAGLTERGLINGLLGSDDE